MRKTTILLLMLLSLVSIKLPARSTTQQPEEGERVKLEKPTGPGEIPRSLDYELSAIFFAESEIIVVTCQGYGCATVSIMSPTMQTLDSDFIDPDITPVACLSTPSIPGQYYIFIVTSSFTAYGTFAVE